MSLSGRIRPSNGVVASVRHRPDKPRAESMPLHGLAR
jgi:hypothetical protein